MKRVFVNRQPTTSVRCQGNRWTRSGLTAVWLRLTAVVALMVLADASFAQRAGAQQTAEPKPLQGFDEAIVTAWKKAGAEVGWMGPKFGFLWFDLQPDGLTAAVPAFRFVRWQENFLAGLSAPAVRSASALAVRL